MTSGTTASTRCRGSRCSTAAGSGVGGRAGRSNRTDRLQFMHALRSPYAFTEHGVIMAATVLNSSKAVERTRGQESVVRKPKSHRG